MLMSQLAPEQAPNFTLPVVTREDTIQYDMYARLGEGVFEAFAVLRRE